MKSHYYRLPILLTMLAGDALILYGAFRLAYYIRFYWPPFLAVFPITKGLQPWEIYRFMILTVLPAWLLIFYLEAGFYKEKFYAALDELIQVVKGTILCMALLMITTFLYRGVELSRLIVFLSGLLSTVLMYTFHQSLKVMDRLALHKIFGRRHILVLGKDKVATAMRNLIERNSCLKGYYLDSLIPPAEFEKFLKEQDIDEVILAYAVTDHVRALPLAEICEGLQVDFKLSPDILELRLGEVIVDQSLGIPLLHFKSIPLHGAAFFFKRLFDIICSMLMVSCCLPFFLLICVLIRLDSPGPIFFKHKRIGYKGRVFDLFKFRTMVRDAESLIHGLKHLSIRSGPSFKMIDDPRVTGIGKFLRRTSLDEIPQIINVLQGEMSFVGPRPLVKEEIEGCNVHTRKRLNVLPGITGLWQVNGRSKLGFDEMLALDLFYLEHWTPGLDLKILLKTLPAVFKAEGAY